MKTITVEVDADGQVQVKTSGYQGAACKDATRELERDLGLATGEQLTAEFRQAAGQGAQRRQGLGGR